jgi:hypothetical protein
VERRGTPNFDQGRVRQGDGGGEAAAEGVGDAASKAAVVAGDVVDTVKDAVGDVVDKARDVVEGDDEEPVQK